VIVEFSIPGVPQQQGSKTATRRGVMYEANKNLKPWREVALSIAIQAREALNVNQWPLFCTAVEVQASCYFPRPAIHYGTGRNAGQLKANAPGWMTGTPDLDKLQRAIGDVLEQSGIVRNDALIVAWQAVKRYGEPRVDVLVQPMDAGERFT
jgi:Holliday junction resolvase RusA-like endonuclease